VHCEIALNNRPSVRVGGSSKRLLMDIDQETQAVLQQNQPPEHVHGKAPSVSGYWHSVLQPIGYPVTTWCDGLLLSLACHLYCHGKSRGWGLDGLTPLPLAVLLFAGAEEHVVQVFCQAFLPSQTASVSYRLSGSEWVPACAVLIALWLNTSEYPLLCCHGTGIPGSLRVWPYSSVRNKGANFPLVVCRTIQHFSSKGNDVFCPAITHEPIIRQNDIALPLCTSLLNF
jgi:hypothetical protein